MMHQRRLAEVRKHLAANEHARSAVDNPQDNPHHLVLAHFDDYLRGEPGISHGAAGPIAGGNPWRSVSHAEENGAEAAPATVVAAVEVGGGAVVLVMREERSRGALAAE